MVLCKCRTKYTYINSIHMLSIPRWKCLSCIRAWNTTSFDALTFRYHACNSHILVGSVGINSSHIRGSPQVEMFFVCPWVNLDWSLFEQLSFCEAAFHHKLSSSCILFGEDFERGYQLLGLLSELGNLVAPKVTWLLPGLCDLAVVVR